MGRKKIYTKEQLDEKRRAYQRNYNQKKDVKEKRSAARKLWSKNNRDKINESKRKNRKKLRKKDFVHFIGEGIKYSARKRGLEAPLTNTEYREWFKSQKQV